jgi:hypothetical protein
MKNDIGPPELSCGDGPIAQPVKVNDPAATQIVQCIAPRIESSFQVK